MRLPLLPAPGLISDDTGFSSQGRYIDAQNIRFFEGKPQPIGGCNKFFGDQLTGVCRNILSWYDNAGNLNIAFGTHSKLYVWKNGTLADITPAGLTAGAQDGAGGPGYGSGDYGEGDYGEGTHTEYFPRTWSLQNWGENLLASPRGGTLYVWENDVATPATVISNAPDVMMAMIVTPQRQVLALATNEEVSGDFNPRCIRGCDLEDYDDWTTATNNNAFEHILEGGDGGNIVAGRVVGAYVGVWTDAGLHLGQFIGAAEQTYRFDPVAPSGLVGPNAVQLDSNGRAWWQTRDYRFYSWAPGETPGSVDCPISDAYTSHIATGQFEKIAATTVGSFGEIWWFYPDSRDGGECSRYISVKTDVGNGNPLQWSQGILARSACIDSGATRNPLFVSPDGYVYSHEDGHTLDGGALSWSFTISLPSLDEGGRFALIKGIEQDIKDQQGAVTLTLALRKYPQSAPVSKGPYTLAVGGVRKHFLCMGRLGEATFAGSSSPSFARFGKPVLLVEPTGAE